jgi:hypothetical protein
MIWRSRTGPAAAKTADTIEIRISTLFFTRAVKVPRRRPPWPRLVPPPVASHACPIWAHDLAATGDGRPESMGAEGSTCDCADTGPRTGDNDLTHEPASPGAAENRFKSYALNQSGSSQEGLIPPCPCASAIERGFRCRQEPISVYILADGAEWRPVRAPGRTVRLFLQTVPGSRPGNRPARVSRGRARRTRGTWHR